MKITAVLSIVALSSLVGGCATSTRALEGTPTASCSSARQIGLFDPARDLLVANYDSKPDVDDLQAVAGLGTVLRHPDFICVEFIAIAGAYGTQAGTFLPATELFNLAFGDRWLDAHYDRENTVAQLSSRMRETIAAGGKVWVAEAGQSDVTAAAVRMLPEPMWTRVNVVQHSFWNESQTSPDAMQLVVYNTRYHRVQDGNFPDNGSPDFNTNDGSYWKPLLSDPHIGPIWREAKRLSDLYNPVAEYVNPAIAAGGLDFSDTVEIAYIFGFDDIDGVGEFLERFVRLD
ncbi:MAG: hypothetical protein R3348_01995 [Xanthomonadales bacterium]|nr:hypothetical protein [Xanthomonadales bacterium]